MNIGRLMLGLSLVAPQLALADEPASPPPPMPHVITNPDWVSGPVQPYFPAAASRAHLSGRAKLECVVNAEGLLENCKVLAEAPAGYGFGYTALTMVGQFRMRPKTRDGQPVGGAIVVIPLDFQYPGSATAPELPPDPPTLVDLTTGLNWTDSDNPSWIRYPDETERAKAYPQTATGRGTGWIRCQVDASGSLFSCSVVAERPQGSGFGAALLKLAPLFKMTPTTPSGKSVAGTMTTVGLSFAAPG